MRLPEERTEPVMVNPKAPFSTGRTGSTTSTMIVGMAGWKTRPPWTQFFGDEPKRPWLTA